MLKNINEENFKGEILDSNKPILVDFYANWCGHKMLEPVIERIGKTRTDFDIAKIDVDTAQNLAYEYEVQVVPTILIFKQGKIVNRIEGFLSESEIIEEMSKYI